MISSSIRAHWDQTNMLVKSAHFLEVYIFFHVIVAVMFITSASSALLASAVLMIELMIFDKHIYLCVFW